MNLKEFFKEKEVLIFGVCIGVVTVLIVAAIILSKLASPGQNSELEPTRYVSNPVTEIIIETTAQTTVETTVTEPAETTVPPTTKAQSTTAAPSTAATTVPQTTVQATSPFTFATAAPAQTPANYQAQWDMGYLIAIDNPDPNYGTPQINLSDEDRDLLERLCYGEFGTGGFIGAALIAQSVKDTMYMDGITSISEVIRRYAYSGSTRSGTSEACRQAVRYVFDENHDAVQHRIIYMYDALMVLSGFHESQNFVLSYQGTRFFDKK